MSGKVAKNQGIQGIQGTKTSDGMEVASPYSDNLIHGKSNEAFDGIEVRFSEYKHKEKHVYEAETAEAEIRGIHTEFTKFKYNTSESALMKENSAKASAGAKNSEKLAGFSAEKAVAKIDGFEVYMENFTYDATFGVRYQSAKVKTQLNFGKTDEEDQKAQYKVEKEDFMEFEFKGNIYNGDEIEAEQFANGLDKGSEVDENGVKRTAKQIKKEIYTKDGFAKLKNPKFKLKRTKEGMELEGEGQVEFLNIPYEYIIPRDKGDKVKKGEAKGGDPIEDVSFKIDAEGNLNATFKDDAEEVLNLNGKNGAGGIINTMTLKNMSIKDGFLKVGSLRTDRGAAVEAEEEEEEETENQEDTGEETDSSDLKLAKSLISNLTFTMARESEKDPSIDESGIHATMAKKGSLGVLKVEEFLGFLNGTLDWPNGKLEVGAEGDFFSVEEEFELEVPLGLPGLNFTLSFKPEFKVGGSVKASASAGGPLRKNWREGKDLELEGELGAEAEGKLAIGAGLSAGCKIAGIGMEVEGAMTVGAKGGLKVKSALAKINGKAQQSKPIELEGELKANIGAEVNLKSSAQFLFWNWEFFNLEIYKEENLAEVKLSGKGSKAVTPPGGKSGWKEGWSFTEQGFSAAWLKGVAEKKFPDKVKTKKADITFSKEKLDKELGEKVAQAEEAWAALYVLSKENYKTLVALPPGKREELDKQINEMTTKVKAATQECINEIKQEQETIKGVIKEQENKLKKIAEVMDKFNTQFSMFETAKSGGFNAEFYNKLADIQDETTYRFKDFESKVKYLTEGQDEKENENWKQKIKEITKKYEQQVTKYDRVTKLRDEDKRFKADLDKLAQKTAKTMGRNDHETMTKDKLEAEFGNRMMQAINQNQPMKPDENQLKYGGEKYQLQMAHDNRMRKIEDGLGDIEKQYNANIDKLIKAKREGKHKKTEEIFARAESEFKLGLLVGEIAKLNVSEIEADYEKSHPNEKFSDLKEDEKAKIYSEKCPYYNILKTKLNDTMIKNLPKNARTFAKKDMTVEGLFRKISTAELTSGEKGKVLDVFVNKKNTDAMGSFEELDKMRGSNVVAKFQFLKHQQGLAETMKAKAGELLAEANKMLQERKDKAEYYEKKLDLFKGKTKVALDDKKYDPASASEAFVNYKEYKKKLKEDAALQKKMQKSLAK